MGRRSGDDLGQNSLENLVFFKMSGIYITERMGSSEPSVKQADFSSIFDEFD